MDRPRLGGAVVTDTGCRGTVSKINVHGKLMVQMEGEEEEEEGGLATSEVRKLSLLSVRSAGPAVRFRIDRFMGKNEDAVRIAASLFSLVAQDFR